MIRPQPKLAVESDTNFLKRHWAFISMMGAFWLADFLLGWIGRNAAGTAFRLLFETTFIAAVLVQPILLGFVLALFPGSLLFRLVLTITAGLFGVLGLAIGIHLFAGGVNAELYESALATGPIMVLSFSVPYLFGKFFFGWEIVFPNETKADKKPQISIVNLIVAMTLVAGSTSLLNMTNEDPIRLLMAVVGMTGVVSVFFVPVTAWVFRGRWFLYVGYACLVGFIAIGIGSVFFSGPIIAPSSLLAYGLLFTWMIVFYGMFLAAIKMSGFTLVIFNQPVNDSVNRIK